MTNLDYSAPRRVVVVDAASGVPIDPAAALPVYTVDPATGLYVAAPSNLLVGRVSLGGADTPGGLFAWQNPVAGSILVTAMYIFYTAHTADPAYGNTFEAGVAATATTASGSVIPDSSQSTDFTGDPAYQGLAGFAATSVKPFVVPQGQWVTGSMTTGSMAGVAGQVVFQYHALS